jgi:hypothetical protein
MIPIFYRNGQLVLMKRIVVEIEDEHMGGSTDENQE